MATRRRRVDNLLLGDKVRRLSRRLFGEDELKVSPKVDSRDQFILKYFPSFILMCIVIWIISLCYQHDYSIAMLIQLLCLVFSTMFALIGIPCFIQMDHGPHSKSMIISLNLIFSLIIWLYMHYTNQLLFDRTVTGVLGALGIGISGMYLNVATFLTTFMLFNFTTVGVMTVMCTYLRRYVVSVLRDMDDHAKKGIRGKAEKFFLVPSIIDVKSVDLEPILFKDKFDYAGFKQLMFYIIILGFIISSYMFVNPYFLDAFDWTIMLAIMLLLSMFVPCLIVPWQLFKSIGAKVCSEGNRDYYLWSGAKNRLFTSFLALSSFMMMFLLSLYFGHDVFSILFNYVAYLLPLIFISCSFAFIYTNNFSINLNKAIFVNFYERADTRSGPSVRNPDLKR